MTSLKESHHTGSNVTNDLGSNVGCRGSLQSFLHFLPEGEGRSEPVTIELKDGRGGLGRATEIKRKQAQAVAFRAMASHKRQKMEHRQKQHFMAHLSNRFSEQQAERDLYKSQKVCEQLDSQMVCARTFASFVGRMWLCCKYDNHQTFVQSLI